MDVDERVKALEEEVLILKNQIQATLLEIQELMLKQAHPSLQIPDAPKESAAAATASATTAAVAPVMLVQDDRAAMPVKLVSAQQQPAPQQPTLPPQPAPQASHKAQTAPLDPSRVPHTAQAQGGIPNWASPEKLEKWAHEKIAKLGTARTRDLVNLYAEDGRYDESIQSYLLRLIDDHERSQKRSQPPAEPPPIKMAPYNAPKSSGRTPPTNMVSNPALPDADADSPDAVALVESALNDAAYIQATLVEAALKQAARNEAASDATSASSSVPSKHNLPVKYAVMPPNNPMQTLSGTTGKPVPPPARSSSEIGDTSGERLILKLIAGVQNAGTKRGKHGQSH